MDKDLRWTAAGSIVGSVLEWYDYVLYGTASALVFDKLFFGNVSTSVGTLLAFATFAIGFLVRPIGGTLFGALGDRIGRRNVLFITLILMGLATTAIGLLPTFASIGVWAPILLVLVRIVQGIGSGSEYAGAVIVMSESSPIKHRGLYSTFPYIGVSAGLLLSSVVFAVFQRMPSDEFMSWGWRIPFLLSMVLVIVGILVRLRMPESPIYKDLVESGRTVRKPFLDVFKTSGKHIVLAWAVGITDNSFAYFFQTYMVAYIAHDLHMPTSLTLITLTALGIVQLFTVPGWGAISDKIGRRPVLMIGSLCSILFAFPLFWLLNTRIEIVIVLSIVLASSVFRGAIVAAQASWYCELFSSNVRYSGFAIGREWSSIFGGLMPVIASAILLMSGGKTWILSVIIIVFALLTFLAAFFGPENFKKSLSNI
ncbi:MAG: MFS transporter [Burkholderiaceae bacterium]|nr:MAG: MFS transporter [Burkholderiaceae bacterium]